MHDGQIQDKVFMNTCIVFDDVANTGGVLLLVLLLLSRVSLSLQQYTQ